jgi:hypothetical protein
MAILYKKNIAIFQGTVTVEEADGLLEWFLKDIKHQVNLGECQFLHAANLQVLMAAKPTIAAWPKDTNLRVWLEAALNTNQGE